MAELRLPHLPESLDHATLIRKLNLWGGGLPRVTGPGVIQTTLGWFNVRDYGARGDGRADDTLALQRAVAAALAANSRGGIVWFPPGTYGVTEDIEIPLGVTFYGAGSRATRIRWISASPPTDAVVTSNLLGQYSSGFMNCCGIRGIRVECVSVAPNAIHLCGWNESCTLDDVEASEFTAKGLWLDAVAQPATNITQNTNFRCIRMVPDDGAVGFYFRDVKRCVFQSLTCDQPSSAVGPTLIGLQLYESCDQNIFLAMNMEDCTTPVDIGEGGSCTANLIDSLVLFAPHVTPADRTFDGYTGTIGIVIHAGSKRNTFLRTRDAERYDALMVDEELGRVILSDGQGTSSSTYYTRIESGEALTAGAVAGAFWITDQEHVVPRLVRGSVEIDTTTTNVDVTFVNQIIVDTSGGDVSISGFAGGVLGQQVAVVKILSAGKLTLVRNSGSATQPLVTPITDIVLGAAHGGVTFECDGASWFVVGQRLPTGSVSVSSDQTALDVSDVTSIVVNTSGGDVNLYGFANGITGQTIDITQVTSANNLIIQHNDASGTQKIISPTGADLTLPNFNGLRLRFNGTNWFPVNYGPGTVAPTFVTSVTAPRFIGNGTAHVAGDYALSAGWGNTATVSTVAARDTGGRVSITCNGSGIAANPTVTLTYKDGTWTTVPTCVPQRADVNAPATATFVPTSDTATTFVLTFLGTPVAGTVYTFSFIVMGK